MTATTPSEILLALRVHGCQVAVRDGQLLVSRQSRLTPDLLTNVRQHRQAIINLLEAEDHALHPSCAPWLHIARQVCAGEFDGGDRSLLGCLFIGVRAINHHACQQARQRLETLLGKAPRKEAKA